MLSPAINGASPHSTMTVRAPAGTAGQATCTAWPVPNWGSWTTKRTP